MILIIITVFYEHQSEVAESGSIPASVAAKPLLILRFWVNVDILYFFLLILSWALKDELGN